MEQKDSLSRYQPKHNNIIFHKGSGGEIDLTLPIDNNEDQTTELPASCHVNENFQHERFIGQRRSPRAMLPSSHDDVRSAAIALTSLSLSPANLSKTSNDVKGLSGKHFAFPPHNTPTDEYATKLFQRYVPTITINQESHKKIYNQLELTQEKEEVSTALLSPRYIHNDVCNLPNHFFQPKPRSFSTNRDFQVSSSCTEKVWKQRSYSFDAVGRAHKYVPGLCDKKDPEILIGQCGHHSPLDYHRDLTGSDEGIGSSGGSADSMEILSHKRKLHRTVFRCMWRGCEKELTTLSGIILHVRHEHIGPSRAGEEEFYFDDVNVDSHATSGVSSNSSTESLVETPTTKENTVILDTLDHVRSKAINIPSIIPSPHPLPTSSLIDTVHKPLQPPIEAPVYSKCIIEPLVHSKCIPIDIDSSASKKAKPFFTIHQPHIIARTLDSPNFNMDFSRISQVSRESALLDNIGDKGATKRRKSSGKKKCRKVYGMSNKDLWCTQCRWKKACARFL